MNHEKVMGDQSILWCASGTIELIRATMPCATGSRVSSKRANLCFFRATLPCLELSSVFIWKVLQATVFQFAKRLSIPIRYLWRSTIFPLSFMNMMNKYNWYHKEKRQHGASRWWTPIRIRIKYKSRRILIILLLLNLTSFTCGWMIHTHSWADLIKSRNASLSYQVYYNYNSQ